MRFLWIVFLVGISLFADEVQRVQSIVNDITKLRADYELCESQVEAFNQKKEGQYQKQILLLEQRIKKQNKLLNKNKKHKIDKKIVFSNCKEENQFPKLIMKEQYKKINNFNKITIFKPSTFRLKKSSLIYNNHNGESIDTWEKGTSFTSNKRSKEMIQITGYFVHKVWVKANKEIWVKAKNTKKR